MPRKVQPGELWQPSASRDNAAAAAAEWVANQQHSQGAPRDRQQLEPDVARIVNASTVDFDLYDVVELQTMPIDPAAALAGWREGPPVYRGRTTVGTTGKSFRGLIALMAEPRPKGSGTGTSLGILSGVTRTRINVTDTDHTHATAIGGSRRLQSTGFPGDPVEILWKESGIGEKYATVRIGQSRPTVGDWRTTGTTLQYGKSYTPFYDPGPTLLTSWHFNGETIRPVTFGGFLLTMAGVWRIQMVLQIATRSCRTSKFELIKVLTDEYSSEEVLRTVYVSHPVGPAGLGGAYGSLSSQAVILCWHPFLEGESFKVRCTATDMYSEPGPYTALPEYFWPVVLEAVCETTLIGNQYPLLANIP